LCYHINFAEEKPNVTIGSWSEFGNCSVTCGGGNQTRTRTCSDGDDNDGESGCDDVITIDTRECNTQCCPG